MSPTSTKQEFTLRKANQTLPLVRMIVQDIVEYSRGIADTRERLEYLSEGRNFDATDVYSEELQSIQESLNVKSERVNKCIEELSALGIQSEHVSEGFVDFPARRDDELVFLCWHVNENEVIHWHHVNEDCTERRPIDLPLIRQSGEASP